MSTKHTPTPWVSPSRCVGIYAPDRNGEMIASTGNSDLKRYPPFPQDECEANAAFIVHAVNNHAALVEALRDELSALKHWLGASDPDIAEGVRISITKISIALKQATAKQAEGGG